MRGSGELMDLIDIIQLATQSLGAVGGLAAIAIVGFMLLRDRTSASTQLIFELKGMMQAESLRGDRYQDRVVILEKESATQTAAITILQDDNKELKETNHKLVEQNEKQAELLTAHETTIGEFKKSDEAKDQTMKELRAKVEEQAQQIAALKTADKEKDATIKRLEEELSTKLGVIDQLSTKVAEQDEEIAQLRDSVRERDNKIEALETRLTEETEKRRAAEKRIDELEKPKPATGEVKSAAPGQPEGKAT